jgi:hypothetical protein
MTYFIFKAFKKSCLEVSFCIVIKKLILLIFLILPLPVLASDEGTIALLLGRSQELNFSDRVSFLSSYFIGKNSTLGPLGEGNFDIFDRDPIYSFTDFDCTTFVETVMALSLSKNVDDFFSTLTKIRYKDGKISFKNRNHFISLDWIPNNSGLGFLSDITSKVGPSQVLKTTIDKKNWYKKLNLNSIKGRDELTDDEKLVLLENLKLLGEEYSPTVAHLQFIKIQDIFNMPQILEKIPDGSIISIVRLNWDLTPSIGTYLDVSHQGLAVWKNGILIYRHASLEFTKVLDVPLIKYLERFVGNEDKVGINIQKILIN